jgi:hypothetical protein
MNDKLEKRMPESLFQAIRENITKIAQEVRPTRHNGRITEFGQRVTECFKEHNVLESEYLYEVSCRMPSKHA